MTYLTTAVRVMIASPSDTGQQRDVVERLLNRWNGERGQATAVSLVPIRYEAHAVPEVAERAQSVINEQLLDTADIVIAIFGNRLGTATDQALSGTVEEIQGATEAGIPVHVYFSSADVPRSQLADAARIDGYKREFSGLYKEYSDDAELSDSVRTAIEKDINRWAGAINGPELTEADPVIQVRRESEMVFNSKGEPKSKTRRWLEITNQGTSDALNFTVEIGNAEGIFFFDAIKEPRTLHSDDLLRLPYDLALGASRDVDVVMRWSEGNEDKEKRRGVSVVT